MFYFTWLHNSLPRVLMYLCMYVQYRSFIISLLHACTCMAPCSIWHVKIHGLSWKIFFHEKSCGIFTTRVLAFTRHVSFPQDVGFPRNESWHLHVTCMAVVIHTVIRQTNPREILLWL